MQRAGMLFFATACWVFYSLLLGDTSLAQDDKYDCASFGSQESAQAELDRDPSDPSNLDADDDGEACESYDYGNGGGGGCGGDGELDCADFATQDEAQAEYGQDTSDPFRLDADNDGIPCEELSGDDPGEIPESTTPERTMPGSPQPRCPAFRCRSSSRQKALSMSRSPLPEEWERTDECAVRGHARGELL
jgi:hypothetical protein